MAVTTSVSIANRALQLLGAERIEAFDEDHPNARDVNVAYDPARKRLLRRYDWNFAIARKSVAADSVDTIYGDLKRFKKPNDFLRLLRRDSSIDGESDRHDWQIEGLYIVTSEAAPLEFRYIKDETTPAVFDPCFSELLACLLARAICRSVTGSATINKEIREAEQEAMADANQTNALENDGRSPPDDDTWLTARL